LPAVGDRRSALDRRSKLKGDVITRDPDPPIADRRL
jgi:hypothetical protein